MVDKRPSVAKKEKEEKAAAKEEKEDAKAEAKDDGGLFAGDEE